MNWQNFRNSIAGLTVTLPLVMWWDREAVRLFIDNSLQTQVFICAVSYLIVVFSFATVKRVLQ